MMMQNETPTTPFGRFWAVVHMKVGKEAARRAFDRIVQQRGYDGPEFLIAKMKLFAASPQANPKSRSPIHPATWLNQGRYDDDVHEWQRDPDVGHNPKPDSPARIRPTDDPARLARYEALGQSPEDGPHR